MSKNILSNDWDLLLAEQFSLPYYIQLRDFLNSEYATKTIYPPLEDVFNALHYTPFSEVKVVILGQDPYHGPNQAHGLSFSVQKDVNIPPSLRNMFKELATDIGCATAPHGNLTAWARQGVLLLNSVLTVQQGKAHAHKGKGWEVFTDHIIQTLNAKEEPIVYILWGNAAKQKAKLIDTEKHYIVSSVHPSPLSAYRGFFGSRPFSKTNEILVETGQQPITWDIPSK